MKKQPDGQRPGKRKKLQNARGNTECRRYMDLMPAVHGKPPMAVLYVEYQETGGAEEVRARFAELRKRMPDAVIAEYLDKSALLRAWALRKAGEPLLHGMPGRRKPVTCVEDNAVPPENYEKLKYDLRRIGYDVFVEDATLHFQKPAGGAQTKAAVPS